MRHILKIRWSDVCPWPIRGMFLSKFWVIAEVQPTRNQKTTRRITASILITRPPVIYGIRWAVLDRNTFKTLKKFRQGRIKKSTDHAGGITFSFYFTIRPLKKKIINIPSLDSMYKSKIWNVITFIFILFKWNWLLPRECYTALIGNISYTYGRDTCWHAVLSGCFIPFSSQWKTCVFGKEKVTAIKQQPCVRDFNSLQCCLSAQPQSCCSPVGYASHGACWFWDNSLLLVEVIVKGTFKMKGWTVSMILYSKPL